MSEAPQTTTVHRLVNLILALLSSDLSQVTAIGLKLLRHILPLQFNPGLYEVLEHEGTLELLDPQGKEVVYHKRQKVRFLQDNIIAYQDKAWGDGDIFADYRCSPGAAVDRYREGHYYRILISLRQTKNRGDIEEFHIERRIRDGFMRPVEDLQTEIDHRTQHLAIRIIFPPERFPKLVSLIEQKRARTTVLGAEHIQMLADRRRQVTWSTDKVRRFEAYIMRWEW